MSESAEKEIKWLYTLKCADQTYYVGTTHNLTQRMKEHWNGRGCVWTKLHPPKKGLTFYPQTSALKEDSRVKELMFEHGIHRVRGGSYSNVDLTSEQIET